MFMSFFYQLKNLGVPVTPTAFLTLHRALLAGLVCNQNDFYIVSRCILVKNERYFDTFDQIFAHHFQGNKLPKIGEAELDEIAREMLNQWLIDPKVLSKALDLDPSLTKNLSADELIKYFKKRLEEQTERHDGGSKWIGTGGTSPVGHSGHHTGGMRVGGKSRNKSAIKVASERRYKEYNTTGPLTRTMTSEALKKLRKLVPSGPRTQVNITKTIEQTTKNGGEIEIYFEQRLKDQIKVILAIDNGGWSMDPYVTIVRTLFHHSRTQFKDIKTYFFHNTIYETVWKDSERFKSPINITKLTKEDRNTRLIIVGDASMAPHEIMSKNGSIYTQSNNTYSSFECLNFLKHTFPHSAWLNPVPVHLWSYTKTIATIGKIFPMFELSIDGLEKAVSHLI